MKYYHGTINREGQNIDIDGFQPVNIDANCSDGNTGVFFTTSLKYACLYAGATRGACDGEVFFISEETHPGLCEKLQKSSLFCTNPDWTGYFENPEEADEYILPWEDATGIIPEWEGIAKEMFEA